MTALPRFILDGNGPEQNRGCQAILDSTVSILDRYFPDAIYVNTPASSSMGASDSDFQHAKLTTVVRSSIGASGCFRQKLRSILRQRDTFAFEPFLREATAVLSLGGDNYTLDYGRPKRFFDAFETVVRAEKPFVLWGASIGPFSSEPALEEEYLGKLQHADLICVRETTTQQYLAEHKLVDTVRLTPDPAFILRPTHVALPALQEQDLRSQPIGVNLSPLISRYLQTGEPWLMLAARLLETIDSLVDSPIYLIPHVVKPSNNDFLFMQELLASLQTTRNTMYLVAPTYSAPELKFIIGQMSVFIGARTHATIAALSSGVPTISLGYSPKANGINKDIFGHTHWLISSSEMTVGKFEEVFRDIVAESRSLKQWLVERMPSYCNGAWEAGAYLQKIL